MRDKAISATWELLDGRYRVEGAGIPLTVEGTVTAEHALDQKFAAVQEVLKEIGAGNKTWDDFWPAFSDLRSFLRHIDNSLWVMALMTIEKAESAARKQNLEGARSAVTEARAQIGWKQ